MVVMRDVLHDFIQSAPAETRGDLKRWGYPEVQANLSMVKARPKSIRKLKARQAMEVIALIDNVETLADVYEQERRVTVRQALRGHPLWARISHEYTCGRCRNINQLEELDEETYTTLLGLPVRHWEERGIVGHCEYGIIKSIELRGSRKSHWQAAVSGSLRRSAAAIVELHQLGGEYIELLKEEDYTGINMRMAIRRSTTHSLDLVRLAVKLGVDDNLDVPDVVWTELLAGYAKENDIAGINNRVCKQRVPWDVAKAYCGALQTEAVVSLIERVRSLRELREILAAVETAGTRGAPANVTGVEGTRAIMESWPELTGEERSTLLRYSHPGCIAEYIAGMWQVLPKIADVPELIEIYLERGITSFRLIDVLTKRDAAASAHLNSVLNEVLTILPPRELFRQDNQLSERAHRYLWEHCGDDVIRQTAVGLLSDWSSTLPELVETARNLHGA
jgi:hypothetical protein